MDSLLMKIAIGNWILIVISQFIYTPILASVGFFYEDEDKLFSITPMGEMLQKDKCRQLS